MNEARSGRTRKARRVAALLLVLALAYLASPYLSFWLFARAIRTNDRGALESYVDFPSLRHSLKDELRGRIPQTADAKKRDRLGSLAARLAPTLIDQLVDAFVTPDGLAALLTDPALAEKAKAHDPTVLTGVPDRRREINWSRVRHASFTGPRTFVANFEGTKLVFRLSPIRWRLKKIQLTDRR